MPEASLWDLVSVWMHTESRPQDFAWVLEVSPDVVESLESRTQQSAARLPQAQARLHGERWQPGEAIPVVRRHAPPQDVLHEALQGSVLPTEAPPLRIFVTNPRTIVVHAHHALCDLAGLLGWLDGLLGDAPPPAPLRLKEHPTPKRKQRHAPPGPSRRLRTSAGPSAPRKFLDIELDPTPLVARAEALGGTYNDQLALAFLDALAAHQSAHGARTDRLALWLPVNVREAPFEGFGNGTSRIRIYRDALDSQLRLQSFATQRRHAKEDGEWCVPSARPAPGLPLALVRPLLHAYLNRPWVDMGSAPFSHAHRLGPPGRFPALTPRTLIMNLHPWHPVGLSGVTHQGLTHLTFTYDPGQLSEGDVDRLRDAFVDGLEGGA